MANGSNRRLFGTRRPAIRRPETLGPTRERTPNAEAAEAIRQLEKGLKRPQSAPSAAQFIEQFESQAQARKAQESAQGIMDSYRRHVEAAADYSPMHQAFSQRERNPGFFKYMLDQFKKGGLNANEAHPETGVTEAHTAAHVGDVRILRNMATHPDINWNALDNNGRTPLQYAVAAGNVDAVRFLAPLTRIGGQLKGQSDLVAAVKDAKTRAGEPAGRRQTVIASQVVSMAQTLANARIHEEGKPHQDIAAFLFSHVKEAMLRRSRFFPQPKSDLKGRPRPNPFTPKQF